MSLSIKAESFVLKQDEFELVSQTHYPALLEANDEALAPMQQRVRALQDRERTLVRSMRRSIRGKTEMRGASFPGNVEKPSRRKQVFTGALKRLNREIARRRAIAARQALKDSARRAFVLKATGSDRDTPLSGRATRSGMVRKENERRRTTVNRAKVGSVSQATKVAQAAKDTPAERNA